MGATTFETTVEITKTPEAAFWQARDQARHEYGHGGYTGTIAEKGSFKVLAILGPVDENKLREVEGKAMDALEKDDGCLIDDDDLPGTKWGPAAAIIFEKDKKAWIRFFGWASC